MAYSLTVLQTALARRGFDFALDAGAGQTAMTQYINSAIQEIDSQYPWPYLLTSTTGTAPITVADLRKVQAVQDVTNGYVPLQPSSVQNLSTEYGDLTITDTPIYFYFTGQTTITTFPTNTDTLKVSYYKVATDLSAGSDTPAMPDRFRPIILELAAAKMFREANVPDEAQIATQEYGRLLSLMQSELLDPQWFSSKTMRVTRLQNY